MARRWHTQSSELEVDQAFENGVCDIAGLVIAAIAPHVSNIDYTGNEVRS